MNESTKLTGTNFDHAVESFQYAMRKNRIEPPGEIVMDGKLHRFRVAGDRPGSKNGWYVLHADEWIVGMYGCWKRGISEKWCSRNYKSLTSEEKDHYQAKMKDLKRQWDEETVKIHAKCSAKFAATWSKSQDATNEHLYLKRKRVNAYGLKLSLDSLMVPLRDADGTLHGIQLISPKGSKKFEAGSQKQGCFHSIGTPIGKIYVCEGYATGASIHGATSEAVAVAFDAGNLKPVAEALHQKYPDVEIIICADDDYTTARNHGLTKATEAARAVNGKLAVPIFPDSRGPNDTDFNDLARLAGLDDVRKCIELAESQKVLNDYKGVHKKNMSIFDEDEHLRQREIVSAVRYRRLADITAKPINWLWPGRFSRGKVSMLAGNPGLGKSQITASMAAIVTTGGMWPVDEVRCEPGNVIFLSAEDDAEDTIRPRLEAAGADLEKVFILDAVTASNGERRSFNLKDHAPRLEEMLLEIGGAALIIIDPITAYMGGTDSHKNADTRALLAPLGELAAKNNAAVVCVSHLNKCASGEALMRVTGSLAFVAAARSAWVVVKDGNDPNRRLFLPLKNNIGNDQTGLAFRIDSYDLPGGIHTSRILWDDEVVTITADDAMAPQGDPEERSALEDAKEFLLNILSNGPLPAKQVKADSDGAGHAWATIRRAKQVLNIEATKNGMKGSWLWKLPPKMLNTLEDAHTKDMGMFDHVEHLRKTSEAISPTEAGNDRSRFVPYVPSMEGANIVTEEEPFFDFDEEFPNPNGGAGC